MPAKESIGKAFVKAVLHNRGRVWALSALTVSFGAGVVAACGSDSDGGPLTATVNDAGQDRGPIITPPKAHEPVAIAAGGSQACVIMDDGRLLCWGQNRYGTIGNPPVKDLEDGGYEFDDRPVTLPLPASLEGVAKVAPGVLMDEDGVLAQTVCAILGDAQVQCWGQNRFGVLGRGDETNSDDVRPRTQAMPVTNLGPSKQVVTNGMTACAVGAGRAQCWGRDQRWVDGGGGSSPTEVPIQNDLRVTQVALGYTHGVALVESGSGGSGSVYGWGSGGRGQLDPDPAYIKDMRSVVEIAAAGFTTCARNTSGEVLCIGNNNFGLLGRGPLGELESKTTARVLLPTEGTAAIQIGMAPDHACALLRNGDIWCWGNNQFGGLGFGKSNGAVADPKTADVPRKVEGLPSPAISIAVGYTFTCALLDTHQVLCWGGNRQGTLGQGTTDTVPHIEPVKVPL